MIIVTEVEDHLFEAAAGDLDYGTLVKVDGFQCLYAIVKVESATDVDVVHKKKHTVLYNMNWGTLRQIPENQVVTVYNGTLSVAKENALKHYKKEK